MKKQQRSNKEKNSHAEVFQKIALNSKFLSCKLFKKKNEKSCLKAYDKRFMLKKIEACSTHLCWE